VGERIFSRHLASMPLVVSERSDRREGHAHGAADAVLALVPQITQGRAGDVCAGPPFVGPGEGMGLGREDEPHQLMIGGVEFDLVDPMTEPVVGSQLGQMAIGRRGELLSLLRTDNGAGAPEFLPSPVHAEHPHRFGQRPTGREGVVVRKGCLVGSAPRGWRSRPAAPR
jgi:hypothetical protein